MPETVKFKSSAHPRFAKQPPVFFFVPDKARRKDTGERTREEKNN